MRKARKRILAIGILVLGLMPSTVSADSLSDMISNSNSGVAESTDTKQDTSTKIVDSVDEGTKELVGTLAPFTKMDEIDERAVNAAEPIKQMMSGICQVMLFVCIALLPFRCLCDIMYVAFPFLRGVLTGEVGVKSGGRGAEIGDYGDDPMGGGFGGGFGGGGRSRGSRSGGRQSKGGSRFVSGAVIAAVNGGKTSVWGVCGKEIILLCIAVPSLMVLTMTGVLAQLGLVIGEVLVGIANSLGSTILSL